MTTPSKLFNQTNQILNNIGAKIKFSETELILTKGEVPYLEEEYGIIINDDVFAFYNNLNGAELEWSFKKNDTSINGFLCMTSFIELLDENTEGKLWVDWYEGEDIKEIKKHRILEYIVGTDYFVTVKFESNGDYKLYYVPEGSVNHRGSKNLHEIPLTIKQYFNVINSYLGFSNIRYHLHKKEFYSAMEAQDLPPNVLLKE